jgi:predicted  nucleic acid-binding Zn-ribbon protein
LQAFLRLAILYYYFRKVSATGDGLEDLKKRLVEAKEELAMLKKVVAKNEEDLRVLGEHSAMMVCEAFDASKARDRVKAKLSKLSEEVEGLCAKNAKLREEHRIFQAKNVELQEDLGQLKEKHFEVLEQLKESQALVDWAVANKVVGEEKF